MSSLRRVFVSYSRSDFYFAEQLAVALRRRSLAAWFDVHELAPGTNWSAAIDGAIEACDVFVLVASRAALQSPYVQRERELGARLGRPQVAVRANRARGLGPLPTYDLRSSFKRGADRLAGDLAAGTPTGWRPRLRLPCPAGAAVYALAPAVSVVFAVVLAALFLHRVLAHRSVAATHVGLRLALVGVSLAVAGLLSAWLLWAFLRRRVGWLNLRGSLVSLPVIAFTSLNLAEQTVGAVSSDIGAAVTALGVSPPPVELLGARAFAVLLLPACLVAGVVTELSPGLCRFLRTGAAPRRIRSRRVGAVPRRDAPISLHTYRLSAAQGDAGVGEEVRRSLSAAGIREADDGERDVVVLSDRTPVDWLSRDDLRDPLAVVATSIALPVRGLLERFQWVDYRGRRKRTLETLARDPAAPAASRGRTQAPEVPEGLQHLRLPVAVVICEWTLYYVAVVAAFVAAYSLTLAASGHPRGHAWPTGLCLLVAPVPVLLARRLRRRRITPLWLVLALTLCWLALIGLGMDGVLRELFRSSDVGSLSAATVTYPAITAAVFALSWRSLRRWLPRRLDTPAGRETLGSSRGSLWWLMVLVPTLVTTVGQALLIPAPSHAPPSFTPARPASTAPAAVCRDRTRIDAMGGPLHAADQAILHATKQTIVAAFEDRTRVALGAVRRLERYRASSKWGAEMTRRLVAALRRTVRADGAFLHRRIHFKKWRAEYGELSRVADDLVKPAC